MRGNGLTRTLTRARPAIATVAAAMALAACGGASSATPTTVAPTTTAPATTTTTATASTTTAPIAPTTSAAATTTTLGTETDTDTDTAPCDVELLDLLLEEPIQFTTGTAGATRANTVDQNALHSYSIEARAGQTMTVTVDGGAVVDIVDATSGVLTSGTNVTVSALPTTGLYFLDVYSPSCDETAYVLTVDIPADGSTATPTPPASPCPNYTPFTTTEGQNWPMRLCQQGPTVLEVQTALLGLGFDVVADGFFGPGTATAVGQWRGDGVGELIPSDLEFLFPFDEDDEATTGSTGQSPTNISNAFVELTAGTDYNEPIQLLAGDTLTVQLLDGGDGTDPFVQLFDSTGTSVAFDDDSGEGPLDARINLVVPTSGDYVINATSVNGISGIVQFQIILN